MSCHFNQILHSDKYRQVLVVDCSNTSSANPHWKMFKKPRYLRNGLVDLDEIACSESIPVARVVENIFWFHKVQLRHVSGCGAGTCSNTLLYLLRILFPKNYSNRFLTEFLKIRRGHWQFFETHCSYSAVVFARLQQSSARCVLTSEFSNKSLIQRACIITMTWRLS